MGRRTNSSTCRLVHIRRLPSVSSMLSDVGNGFDEDRLRERTCSITRRSSFENSTTFPSIPISTTETNVTPIRISTIIFNRNFVEEEKVTSIDRIKNFNSDENLWVDVVGTDDKDGLNAIGQHFQIHPLVLADIATKEQRTKLDVLGDDLFLVVKLIYLDRTNSSKAHVEQMTFYLKENILLTFQETSKNIFDQVKKQIRLKKGRIVGSKIDYLLYVLFDTIVDNYVDVLHMVNGQIEKIEEQMIKHTSRDNLEVIYDLKREMLLYRSFVYPLKEIIIKLRKEEETEIIQEGTVIYLKDLYDHVVQVTDTISAYRETLASFIDFYMMLNSNAMSEIVKTLTIISTIFIPLTFIAGVYGMNFDNMPELHWKYGYYLVLSSMVGLTLILLFCFRRKRWF